MPKISVIVPVYNVELCIARCVDSLLSQTFTDFELLLIDDGSPDNSGKICDEYAGKDSRIKVIHRLNSGAAAARNAGIKAAKGEYIGFVDSDDYVAENFLETLINTALKSRSSITMCNYFSLHGKQENLHSHGFSDGTVLSKNQIQEIIYDNIFSIKNTDGYFQLWNKLFKRDLIAKNNITLYKDMSFGEDMLFVMECLKFADSIAFTENAGYYYEKTAGGLFSTYRRSFIGDITRCYVALIEQTAPKNHTKEDLIPISYKYWNYINRHLEDIPKFEKHPFYQMRQVLKSKTVRSVFSVMANMPKDKANEIGIEQNELIQARLLSKGFVCAATFVADYQFNENFWLRRIRQC